MIAFSLSILNCTPPEPSEIKKGSKTVISEDNANVGSNNSEKDSGTGDTDVGNGSGSDGNGKAETENGSSDNDNDNSDSNEGNGDNDPGDSTDNGGGASGLDACVDGPQDYLQTNIPKLINGICDGNFSDITALADANTGVSQAGSIQFVELISPAPVPGSNILEAMFASSFLISSGDIPAILANLIDFNQNAVYDDGLSQPGVTFGPQGNYSADSEFFNAGWIIREKRIVDAGGIAGQQTANYDLERAVFSVDEQLIYLSDIFLNAIDARTVAVNRLHMIYPLNGQQALVIVTNHLQADVPAIGRNIANDAMRDGFQELVLEYQSLLAP